LGARCRRTRCGKPPRDLARLSLKLFLFEGVDELYGREEPDALSVMLDGLDADSRGEVHLARARTADQDDVVRILEKLAAVKLAHERLVHFTAGEIEAAKIAVIWEARGFELVGG
jgi:hypothetical protein